MGWVEPRDDGSGGSGSTGTGGGSVALRAGSKQVIAKGDNISR